MSQELYEATLLIDNKVLKVPKDIAQRFIEGLRNLKAPVSTVQTEPITPEYIAEMVYILTKEEIIDMIREYGSDQADTASYWASKNG